MTVWRATNPHAGDFPTGVDLADREVIGVSSISTFMPQNPHIRNRRPQQRKTLTVSNLFCISYFYPLEDV